MRQEAAWKSVDRRNGDDVRLFSNVLFSLSLTDLQLLYLHCFHMIRFSLPSNVPLFLCQVLCNSQLMRSSHSFRHRPLPSFFSLFFYMECTFNFIHELRRAHESQRSAGASFVRIEPFTFFSKAFLQQEMHAKNSAKVSCISNGHWIFP